MEPIVIDGRSLDLDDLVAVARDGAPVVLDPAALERVARSRALVDRCVDEGLVRYGITTGFGKFSDVVIDREKNAALQKNLIMSHACGVGDPFPVEVVRAMLLLRANALMVGYSGIRPSTILALVNLLEAGIAPVVPEKGSLGSSGDLAPLSHMALVLCGMGEAFYKGERMPGGRALELAGLEPVELAAKEGLALINGTQAMTAVAALAVHDALAFSRTADLVAALSHQALRGVTDAYDGRIHALRGQPGQEDSAAFLRELLAGSRLTSRQGELRVQDAYALRCVPQVHGASRDAIEHVAEVVSRELGAVTDNPLIFPSDDPDMDAVAGIIAADEGEGAIISGGNFHGQPVALAMDYLGIALAELANISERRTERLVNPALSNGLPAFLTREGGVNSGFMIMQYAAAALVSENKVLAHPASVDSIPSSANQEDHVSMGTIAARKARQILGNARDALAIELLAACQAVDLRGGPDALSPATAAAYRALRSVVPGVDADRVMYPDIAAAASLVHDGTILDAALEAMAADSE
ncbi:MAG: histidine ammonia-lyase [Spirochaetia bacterium]|nr:histidine ammonia-lyase [Spirochaetia bacterium]